MNFIIKQNQVSSVLNKNGSIFIKNEPSNLKLIYKHLKSF
nr:hypothetical protein [Acinetobacter baumannii]